MFIMTMHFMVLASCHARVDLLGFGKRVLMSKSGRQSRKAGAYLEKRASTLKRKALYCPPSDISKLRSIFTSAHWLRSAG